MRWLKEDRTRCYTSDMTAAEAPRTFETAWVSKAARKALIAVHKICDAMGQVLKWQCDDLG